MRPYLPERGPDSQLIGIGEAVERLRPEFDDVSISSLRFLEREGLVEPKRTPGGHRAFDDRDLDRIRLIKRLQLQHRTLAEIRELLELADAGSAPSEYISQFVDAITQRDSDRAAAILAEAGQGGLSLRTLCFEILAPVLVEIGARWEQGSMTVGQEHLASALVRDLLGSIRSRSRVAPRPATTAVAVCAAGEHHELGLLMIVTLLEELGLGVYFLGADTPPESAARLATETGARYLLVSIGSFADPDFLRQVLDQVDTNTTAVIAGGLGCYQLTGELRNRCALVCPSGAELLGWIADRERIQPNGLVR